jgi:leader peptidase (prepilin peptidase)/N-methyltransferase
VALAPRTWYARHGWVRAFGLMLARLRRERSTWRILWMGLIGSAVLLAVWFLRGDPWAGLLSALVGMAAGVGIIWPIRVIGSAVLRREAMGFGDVTLMAMIGVFLGWQPCLIIFFLAPFAGVVVGLVSLILRRGPEIPFGPFLCMATLVVIVGWAAVWEWSSPIFGLGSLLILVVLACFPLMVPLLVLIQLVRPLFGRLARTLFGG